MNNTNHPPLVSVIIIFLNAERFIKQAIESVLRQTYDNWELLLVDDGSTDGSSEIARRYAEHTPNKTRYLEHAGHTNRGMSASRNLGIRHANGKYIGFLDADDVWLPHKLKRQVEILDTHPKVGMVYGVSQYWHSWNGDSGATQSDYILDLGVRPNTVVQPPALLTLLLKSKAPTPCPSDMLLRRETVGSVGGFEESFRGKYQLFEDQAFLAKVYLETPVFVSGEYWDRYRQHVDSCVSVVNGAGQKYSAGLFFFSWLEKYLSCKGITDVQLWRALRNKRWRYRRANLYRALEQVRGCETQSQEFLKSVARRVRLTYRQIISAGNRRSVNGHTDRMANPNIVLSSQVPDSEAHLVSIVIPCHNQAQFLSDAIESVLTQNYRSIEIVVVDDGSTDNTSEVAARYPEVHCVRQENQGLSAARNTGFTKSRGQYVLFLDADDRLLSGALKVGVESLINHPECAFVYGHLRFIAADGSPLPTPKQLRIEKDHCLELLRGDYIWTPGVVMYRRHVLEVVGGFNPRIDACADCDLNIRITRDFLAHSHGQIVLEYRQHGGSMSGNSALMLKTAMVAHRLQLKYVRGNRRYEEASKIGKRAAQDYFGRHLMNDVRSHTTRRDFKHSLKALLILLRYHPRGFARCAWLALHEVSSKAHNGLGFFPHSR